MIRSHRSTPFRTLAGLLVVFVLLSLSGCDYLKFVGQKRTLKNEFHNHPKMELLRELSPENCYTLFGELDHPKDYDGSFLVVGVSDRYQNREIVAKRVVLSPALFYSVMVPEGDYDIYVFADLNGDDLFRDDELVGRTTPGKPIPVGRKYAEDNILVKGPTLHLDLDHPQKADFPLAVGGITRKSRYASLDDEFFDPRYGTMGLYRPMELLAHTQGPFFQLEDYDPHKTLVLFVHGVEGTPQDWKYMVAGLDRKKFQPWFYFYPSGLPLEKLGNTLARSIMLLDQTPGYGISNLIIVAHSMGGLVARAAIDRLCRDGKPRYFRMYISFSSPYGGIEEAREGVKSAPAMVPCWIDVASDSEFLQRIYSTDLPKDVPFYLFFGYRNKSGASGDGTITLRSQLDDRIYVKAVKTYGFDATHVGILNDASVRKVFNEILETVEP